MVNLLSNKIRWRLNTAFFIFLFDSDGDYVILLVCQTNGGQMKNEKLWTMLNTILNRLKHGRYWVTSLDPYRQDIDDAIESLEKARKKIEEEK